MFVVEGIWDFVTTVLNAVLVTLESVLGWVLSGLALVVDLVLMTPIVGRLIRWALHLILEAVWWLVGLLDFVLCLVGFRPEKKLRVNVLILKDANGNSVATPGTVVARLQDAVDVFFEQANVRIVRNAPFQYNSRICRPGDRECRLDLRGRRGVLGRFTRCRLRCCRRR